MNNLLSTVGRYGDIMIKDIEEDEDEETEE